MEHNNRKTKICPCCRVRGKVHTGPFLMDELCIECWIQWIILLKNYDVHGILKFKRRTRIKHLRDFIEEGKVINGLESL